MKIFSFVIAIICCIMSVIGLGIGLIDNSPMLAYFLGMPSALAAFAWFIIYYKEDRK